VADAVLVQEAHAVGDALADCEEPLVRHLHFGLGVDP
jgi:hypothetical protein